MKRLFMILISCGLSTSVIAQEQEAQQLLLNWQKLAQLRAILKNMYKGYQVLSEGYNRIKGIAEGNFTLHQVFLDGLLEVSPTVRKYYKVADILKKQKLLVEEGKKALAYFKATGEFTPQEIGYLGNVYAHLLEESLGELDGLLMVITASKLRMSDDERLGAIDRIFSAVEDKLSFLRSFTGDTNVLARLRVQERVQVELSRKINGTK